MPLTTRCFFPTFPDVGGCFFPKALKGDTCPESFEIKRMSFTGGIMKTHCKMTSSCFLQVSLNILTFEKTSIVMSDIVLFLPWNTFKVKATWRRHLFDFMLCSNVVGKAGPQNPSVMILYIHNNNIKYPMFWNVCQNDITTYNHIKPTIFSHGNAVPDAQCTAELCGDGSPNLDGLEARDNQQQIPTRLTTFFVGNPELNLYLPRFLSCVTGCLMQDIFRRSVCFLC